MLQVLLQLLAVLLAVLLFLLLKLRGLMLLLLLLLLVCLLPTITAPVSRRVGFFNTAVPMVYWRRGGLLHLDTTAPVSGRSW